MVELALDLADQGLKREEVIEQLEAQEVKSIIEKSFPETRITIEELGPDFYSMLNRCLEIIFDKFNKGYKEELELKMNISIEVSRLFLLYINKGAKLQFYGTFMLCILFCSEF